MRIRPLTPLLLLLSVLVTGHEVAAQSWAPVSVGGRVGYDNKQRDEVLGAHIRIPVVRSGLVEVMPNFDATFRAVFNEYQFNLDAVYVLGDRSGGGVYAGGGIGLRSLVVTGPRETVQTFNLVAGLKLAGLGRVVPQAEFRWVFVDELPLDPQQVTLGVSIALWNRPRGPL